MIDFDITRLHEALFYCFMDLDGKRPGAWESYGYKRALTFEDFQQAYDRGGAAHGAVHRLLDGCWQKLRDLDRRNLVGRYSALIYRMADSQPLSAPLAAGERAERPRQADEPGQGRRGDALSVPGGPDLAAVRRERVARDGGLRAARRRRHAGGERPR